MRLSGGGLIPGRSIIIRNQRRLSQLLLQSIVLASEARNDRLELGNVAVGRWIVGETSAWMVISIRFCSGSMFAVGEGKLTFGSLPFPSLGLGRRRVRLL